MTEQTAPINVETVDEESDSEPHYEDSNEYPQQPLPPLYEETPGQHTPPAGSTSAVFTGVPVTSWSSPATPGFTTNSATSSQEDRTSSFIQQQPSPPATDPGFQLNDSRISSFRIPLHFDDEWDTKSKIYLILTSSSVPPTYLSWLTNYLLIHNYATLRESLYQYHPTEHRGNHLDYYMAACAFNLRTCVTHAVPTLLVWGFHEWALHEFPTKEAAIASLDHPAASTERELTTKFALYLSPRWEKMVRRLRQATDRGNKELEELSRVSRKLDQVRREHEAAGLPYHPPPEDDLLAPYSDRGGFTGVPPPLNAIERMPPPPPPVHPTLPPNGTTPTQPTLPTQNPAVTPNRHQFPPYPQPSTTFQFRSPGFTSQSQQPVDPCGGG